MSFHSIPLVLVLGSVGFGAPPAKVLVLPKSGDDPDKIDYKSLPVLTGKHAVVRPAALDPAHAGRAKYDMHHATFQLHNYLVRHGGRFWCIWSEGPPIEDEPTQEVRYSTSKDGLTWTPAKSVTGRPEAPYAFIARGLWVRDGKLLALAAHFKGKGAFGSDKELALLAYRWSAAKGRWERAGKLYDDAINNFPPQRLADGDWILTRRDSRFNVSVLIGGRKALDSWKSYPVVGVRGVPGFRPDEPIFWPIDDKTLFALYRDNAGSRRLFHSTSGDSGRTWTKPVLTNFPNATSKLFSMKTSRGYRVLVSNANPSVGRRELHLSVSKDGRTFVRMARLEMPSPPKVESLARIWAKFRSGVASVQYPHVIEHEGHLWIAFSRDKKQIEVLRVALDDVDALLKE